MWNRNPTMKSSPAGAAYSGGARLPMSRLAGTLAPPNQMMTLLTEFGISRFPFSSMMSALTGLGKRPGFFNPGLRGRNRFSLRC